MFSTWLSLVMQIGVEKMLKLTNLTNKLNIQFHVWVVKFQPKIEKWTWIHMMRFSCRIMKKHVSIDFEMFFMRFIWKCFYASHDEWVSLMEFDGRKCFEVYGKSAFSWENKWEVWVFILRKVFSLEKLGWNDKSWKTQAKSSLLLKISSKLPLLGSSHSLQI